MVRTLVLSEILVRAIATGRYPGMRAAARLLIVIANAETHADHSAGTDDRSAFLSKRRVSEGNALAPSNIFR